MDVIRVSSPEGDRRYSAVRMHLEVRLRAGGRGEAEDPAA
jgi:hypothetical protein